MPGNAAVVSDVVLNHRDLAGVHFTGSTDVFNSMWRTIGAQMDRYRSYPRIVGETGGKDFIVAHASADPQALAVAVVRGGYEYQGQKCSAVSRIYVPRSLWNDVRDRVVAMMAEIKVGDIADFRNFMGAVIDKKAFDSISAYLAEAKRSATVLAGGGVNGDTGYFIQPTLVETADPGYKLLCEEIFGPVVTAYVYDDDKWAETLRRRRRDLALRPHGRRLRQRPPGGAPGGRRAARRRRQLLRERQADGRGRGPAAVRRGARLGHQRQGRLEAQPGALGERARGEGDLQPAARLPLPVHGGGIAPQGSGVCSSVASRSRK